MAIATIEVPLISCTCVCVCVVGIGLGLAWYCLNEVLLSSELWIIREYLCEC